jgi:predicted Fe-Mo cluster-binding NifX family protein
MRIAVASKDGIEINEHFGHAERFLLFDVEGSEVTPAGEIPVERYCSDDPDHQLRKPVIKAIAGNLGGCRAVVCSRIGQAPLMELESLGIEVYSVTGPIRPTLLELSKVM